jgi:hypothetical protein
LAPPIPPQYGVLRMQPKLAANAQKVPIRFMQDTAIFLPSAVPLRWLRARLVWRSSRFARIAHHLTEMVRHCALLPEWFVASEQDI